MHNQPFFRGYDPAVGETETLQPPEDEERGQRVYTRQNQREMIARKVADRPPGGPQGKPFELHDACRPAGSGLHQLCSLVSLNCRSFHCSTVLSRRHWLPAM